MKFNDAAGMVRTVLSVASMVLAAAAILKMAGLAGIRFSITELAVVAIACALAK